MGIILTLSVCLTGNALREDFTFRHSFSAEVAKLLKASPGQIVILHPEKFRSKYEPSSHTLAVKVRFSFYKKKKKSRFQLNLNWFHRL